MCSRRSLRKNVKNSMTHNNREQYVGPATTSSVWQPARKTGKQASDCWMLPWSMHALSCGARRGASGTSISNTYSNNIYAKPT